MGLNILIPRIVITQSLLLLDVKLSYKFISMQKNPPLVHVDYLNLKKVNKWNVLRISFSQFIVDKISLRIFSS